jgi:cob(I)alamin adenosyltransferase
MKIYTKTGDDGTTGLHNGSRVPKNSYRVETYGTVDELNSIIGIISSLDVPELMKHTLEKINKFLFELGSDLASPLENNTFEVVRIGEHHIVWLETLIDEYEKQLPPLKNFILPGGTILSAYLHNARTICRRAERKAVTLSNYENIGEHVIIFLNRLSDFFFVAARMANYLAGVHDVKWTK